MDTVSLKAWEQLDEKYMASLERIAELEAENTRLREGLRAARSILAGLSGLSFTKKAIAAIDAVLGKT